MKNLVIKFLNWFKRKFNRFNRSAADIIDNIEDYAFCDYCGDMFQKKRKNHKFCSRKCSRRLHYEKTGR